MKFEWNIVHAQEDFLRLKNALSTPPALGFPRPGCKFVLNTDVSDDSLGAVLSQTQDDSEKVTAYYSHLLKKAEQNYRVTRWELLAVVKSLLCFSISRTWKDRWPGAWKHCNNTSSRLNIEMTKDMQTQMPSRSTLTCLGTVAHARRVSNAPNPAVHHPHHL